MAYQLNQYLFSLLVICFLDVGVANSLSALQASCPDDERSALLQFKHSFILDCDARQPMLSWVDQDCCLWDGVKCNNKTGNVIGLDLSSSCLYGTFPPNTTLFSLSYLEYLDLSYNNFNNSPIPFGFGDKLSKLQGLNLSFSRFSGQVPSDFSKLSKLSILDLSSNSELQLKALSLERLVQNMTQLNQLNLDKVDISSPVPNLLANLTSLTSVSLDYCNLYGKFPTSMFHLPHLQDLSVFANPYLTGFLPKFEHSSPLRRLQISTTSFFGKLPPSIGSLAHLQQLSLGDCKFSGHIPSSIGNLTKLSILELDNNDFIGNLPSSFTNLTKLQTLSISSLNTSSDELFIWLSKQNKLLKLLLQDMKLTGEIPAILANFTNLEYLNLNQNFLTGQIPHWLMNLTHLHYLSLTENQFAGSIPSSISHLERLHLLYLYGNSNLLANFYTLLKLRHLKYVDLSGLTLTLDSNITTNESVAKLSYLSLVACNLTKFPQFLLTQDELQLLQLRDNKIEGVIPLWLVNVTGDSLLALDLSYNFLTGFEQPTKFLPWVNMEILFLDGNKIQGSLPIPSHSVLNYGAYNNSFTGDIPLEICQASSLIYLDLSYNQLSGKLPECIVHLGDSLQVLDLGGNTFHGTIPSGYPKSSKLKMINLSINQLSGNLPRSLANCKMLEVLDIASNQISDSFPSWLGSLPHLQILVLRHNKFHGEIGTQNDSFGFHSLRILDLSHNFHTGSLPTGYFEKWEAMKVASQANSDTYTTSFTITISTSPYYVTQQVEYDYTTTIGIKGNDMLYMKMLTVFRLIDFSSNNFTGKIPDFIGQLKGLQAINLSNNNLEGGIPPSLANIRNLESLDFSNNKLSGEIPQQLVLITSLEIFNVSHNLLFGPIPHGNQFDTFDNTSFEGNLGLCGGTLSKKCGKIKELPPPVSVTNTDKDDNSTSIDWVIRSLGCISGFVIGGVIGKYMTDKNHEWFVETFRRDKRKKRSRPRQRS